MSSKLFRQERREQIVELLEQEGRVSVADLCTRFDISAATIRSDLDALVRQGLIVRTHGGAISADHNGNAEMSFGVRSRMYTAEKRRIGAAAAEMVEDGEAIALDASTTALTLAEAIQGHHELTVITNGLYTALALLGTPGITILMPSGFLRQDSVSLVGIEERDVVTRYHFQKVFFGAKGLTLEEGLTDVNRDEVAFKRDLVQHAKQVIAIVDSSKWRRVGFASFASIDQIDCIITDDGAPAEMVNVLRERGIRVVLV